MLKTTYRAAPAKPVDAPLPPGWTEHKAPTGHTYYYNAETKQSTYTRPAADAEPADLQIDYDATAPDRVVQASMKALDEFNKNNQDVGRGKGNFSGGRSYQDRNRQNKHQDRPKTKHPIPNCEPWLLVKTKFGRRFVHNTETKDSFWKFPQDVMMAVIEMDRLEWEAKKKAEELKEQPEATDQVEAVGPAPAATTAANQPDFDSDEYEEVEVTDDEGDDPAAPKRPRTNEDYDTAEQGPKAVEFDEDDIAWQLAEMEAEEEDAYSDENADQAIEDEAEDEAGLTLTAEESTSLFRSLLDDTNIDPYSTFDALIDPHNPISTSIIEDPRWTSLPNMSSRRTAFADWSRDRVAELKAHESTTKKRRDPRVAYLDLLCQYATPKLYWPEFKRKYRKESEMKDLHLADKEREKLYREYIGKLKASEADRKREFRDLLKSIRVGDGWSRSTRLDDLPHELVKDLRFYLVRDGQARNELVRVHLETLKD